MKDVPTELLRSLVTVVDFRNYTKAARSLGVTQPAVSGHIKRLQDLLAVELFDKSAPGVNLTSEGELVVDYARRMLSINDQLLTRIRPTASPATLQIGIPSDFVEPMLPSAIARFRQHLPNLRCNIRSDISENLVRDLRRGELDLAVALSASEPELDGRRCWSEEVVWLRSEATRLDSEKPVPLVAFTDNCVYGRLAASALTRAGRKYDIVFTGTSIASLTSAVTAGLGVMLLARRAVPTELIVWHDAPLPKLPDLFCGVYLRDGRDRDTLTPLADGIADVFRPQAAVE